MDPSVALQLLREHKRDLAGLPGGSGRDAKPGAPLKRWTFDESIAALDKKLQALGVRRGLIAPEDQAPPAGPGIGQDEGDSD
jgi:hypothetical protein